MRTIFSSTVVLLAISWAFSFLLANAEVVKVHLSYGTVVTGRSNGRIDTFNGIPYAEPPLGDLRLRPPQEPRFYHDEVDATGTAAACSQMLVSKANGDIISKLGNKILHLPLFNRLTGQEDCLTISVQRPANTKPDAKLPVIFWIYGGGFLFGSTNTYDGSSMLAEGISNNMPFIYVAVNYRLNGFGFLPGAEVRANGIGNLGLLDQRLGLKWVADNIGQFGGDPERVTLWGESAGGHAIFYQMALHGGNATYKGKPLFRGAIISSGVGLPAEPIDGRKGQAIYDTVVKETGCINATDTLACLRSTDYDTYYKAVTENFASSFSYYGTKITYVPRPDGNVLLTSPEEAAATGKYFAVPIIVGNQEDEGTLFSLFQQSIRTDEDLANYWSEVYFEHASKEVLTEWVKSYSRAGVGSPFRTSRFNKFYPMFGQIAAMIGDQTFIMSRRNFLESATAAHPEVPAWSYLSSYAHQLPILGTAHASDLSQIFYGMPQTYATKSTRKYYLNFIYNLNPNSDSDGYLHWPCWQDNKTLLWFETQFKNSYLKDDFRSEQNAALLKLGYSARQ